MSEIAKLAAKTPEAKRENSLSDRKKTNFSQSINSPLAQILYLQRTVGNQAVERLLKTGVIQAKLTIGHTGDVYEQEADRVAEQVMRMPDPGTTGSKGVSEYNQVPSIQRVCTECEEELQRQTQNSQLGHLELGSSSQEELHRQPMEEEEEEEIPQTKQVRGGTPEVAPDIAANIKALSGCGQPLPESVRNFFEPRFGYDFSNVRLHTDAVAAKSAQSINAAAYTVGNDVVFGAGHYAPERGSGKRLIAHELAHTIQQSGGGRCIQRFVECLPITMAITPGDKRCPDRVPGEIGRSRSSPMFVWELKNPHGWLVEDFAIGSSAIKNNLESDQRWIAFKEQMVKQTDKRWEILGFSDCSGEEGKNKSLREDRALAVFSMLAESVQQRIDNAEDAFIGDCIVGNKSEIGRSLNRSAFIRITGISYPTKEITVQLPKPKPKPTAETVGCHKSEQDKLSLAYPIAIDMVEKALDVMRGRATPERKALLEKFFNDSSVSTILHVTAGFKSIYEGIKTSFNFECEHKGEWFYDHFCDKTSKFVTLGYVRPFGLRVHICESAFERDTKTIARVIVHECSHKFDFTSDVQYCSLAGCPKTFSREFAKISLQVPFSRWEAYDNADSYAWFAFEAYKL